jgi:hypothetical protein
LYAETTSAADGTTLRAAQVKPAVCDERKAPASLGCKSTLTRCSNIARCCSAGFVLPPPFHERHFVGSLGADVNGGGIVIRELRHQPAATRHDDTGAFFKLSEVGRPAKPGAAIEGINVTLLSVQGDHFAFRDQHAARRRNAERRRNLKYALLFRWEYCRF